MTTLTREFPLPTEGERIILRSDQLARFWPKVTKLVIEPEYGECWVWTAAMSQGEYGRLFLGYEEREDGSLAQVYRASHVLSYMHHVGPIPPGWVVDHMCNHKACVNPDHLECIPNLVNLRRAHERRPWKRLNQFAGDFTKDESEVDWRFKL